VETIVLGVYGDIGETLWESTGATDFGLENATPSDLYNRSGLERGTTGRFGGGFEEYFNGGACGQVWRKFSGLGN